MGSRARPASRREPAAQLVLDMDADDLLEGVLCREAELARAARVEAARPAGNDARDDRVGLAPDALRHVVARDGEHAKGHRQLDWLWPRQGTRRPVTGRLM